MGFHAIPADDLDNQLLVRRLDPDDKRDVSGVRAGGVDVLEFGPLRSCVGLSAIFFESGRVREKTRMGLVENQSGDVWVLRDLAVVLIQSRQSET